MVQELIPGGGKQQFSYCAFFRGGRAVGKHGGAAPAPASHLSLDAPARMSRPWIFRFWRSSPSDFFEQIDYYGLVEVEYKLDPRDGQYKLLDVNARTWGYHSLGVRAGVDFTTCSSPTSWQCR